MNNGSSGKKKTGAGSWLSLVLFLIGLSAIEESVAVGLILIGLGLMLFSRSRKKDKAGTQTENGAPEDIPQEPASLSKMITESKKEQELDSCDADHAHAEKYRGLSDDDKRREQLKGMLSAGLIDKEEYVIMLKKYGLK